MTTDELAVYFAGAGCGTLGGDLFVWQFPEPGPDPCAVIREGDGWPVERALAGAVEWERAEVMVLVRDTHYYDARVRAQLFYDAALALANVALSGCWYLQAEPLCPPYLVERDDLGRSVLGFALDVWKVPSELPS